MRYASSVKRFSRTVLVGILESVVGSLESVICSLSPVLFARIDLSKAREAELPFVFTRQAVKCTSLDLIRLYGQFKGTYSVVMLSRILFAIVYASEIIKGVLIEPFADIIFSSLCRSIRKHFVRERERNKVQVLECITHSLDVTIVALLSCSEFVILSTDYAELIHMVRINAGQAIVENVRQG